MKREVEEKNRQMLRTEFLITIPTVIAGVGMVFIASFIEMSMWLRIVILAFSIMLKAMSD